MIDETMTQGTSNSNSNDSIENVLLSEIHQLKQTLNDLNQRLLYQERDVPYGDFASIMASSKSELSLAQKVSLLKKQIVRLEKKIDKKTKEVDKIIHDKREHEKYMAMMRIKELELKRDMLSNSSEDIATMMEQLRGDKDV